MWSLMPDWLGIEKNTDGLGNDIKHDTKTAYCLGIVM